jgi:hypothetical protein
MAASPATRWCLTLTDPAGVPLAHACAPRARARARGRGGGPGPPRAGPPPSGPGALAWAASLAPQIAWLETSPCQHTRSEDRYRPSASLRHLVQIRYPECTYLGCRRPSHRSDIDHVIPYDQGGKTCECNLQPPCRTHHRAKQAPGWHLEQPEPGVLIWHTPHQRSYQAKPHHYPV